MSTSTEKDICFPCFTALQNKLAAMIMQGCRIASITRDIKLILIKIKKVLIPNTISNITSNIRQFAKKPQYVKYYYLSFTKFNLYFHFIPVCYTLLGCFTYSCSSLYHIRNNSSHANIAFQ